MEHYWMTFCNDAIPLFDTKCWTKAEAIRELKEAYRFDKEQSFDGADFNEYYIEEHFESDVVDYCRITEYYKMTMDECGEITAKRVK